MQKDSDSFPRGERKKEKKRKEKKRKGEGNVLGELQPTASTNTRRIFRKMFLIQKNAREI
jgi:hypothetical protein